MRHEPEDHAPQEEEKMKQTIRFFMVVVLTGLICAPALWAENRALIIGIGQGYTDYGINRIDGPARDVELARELAGKMGFRKENIRVLQEGDATQAAILRGFKWLKQGVQRGDRALIYYSGHGSQLPDQNHDEDDGCDEVLVPVDGVSDSKLIVDDEIGRYLKALKQKGVQVVFIVDSCFSGTVTKGLYPWHPNSKFLHKSSASCGVPVNVKSVDVTEDAGRDGNMVVLTATAQNEVALGDVTDSGKGSLFTQAISDTVEREGLDVTFRTLRDTSAKTIREICRRAGTLPHTPQLEGDSDLFDQDIALRHRSQTVQGGIEGAANNRELMEQIVGNSKFMVAMRTPRQEIPIGELISFSVTSSKKGYLNLVEVEPSGDLNVIFPNGYTSENQIAANQELNIPRDIGGFKFRARKPAGDSKIVAMVTPKPLNLYTEKSLGESLGKFKSIHGGQLEAIKSVIERSVGVESDQGNYDDFGASSLVIRVR